MESNQRKIGVILSYVSIGINTIIQLLYTPFLIRMLGQNEYGLYSLIYSIIGYLTVLDLGFGNAIIVYTAKYRANKEYDKEKKLHGMFFIIFCIIGIIAALGGLLLYYNIDNLFSDTMTALEISKAKIMMLILSFNLLITFVFNIFNSIISAYENFVFQKIVVILNNLLKPIIMIPLLFLGYKSIALCIVVTLVNLFVMISNFIYCKKKLNIAIKFIGFDKALFKTILGYSIWIFLGIIVDKINWSVDQFVLGAVSGTVAVSIYSVASTLNQVFISLSTAISGVFLPKISKLVAKNKNTSLLTEEFIKIGRIQYYIIFLMCSGFVLFGKTFINLWAGQGFEETYYVALLLIIPICIPLIQNLGISIMQAKNMHKFRSVLLVGIAIFNIIISIPLAKLYGAIGTAIGTAISLIIGNIIVLNIYYQIRVKIDVITFWKNIIKMTIPFIMPLLITILLIQLININDIISLLLFGTIYVILYCITSYFIVTNKYEKKLINNILKKLFKRMG